MRQEWTVKHIEECDSTFTPARKLEPWTAIYANEQHHGRGRFNRSWFGAKGGLWVCYNIPIDESLPLHWGILPLVAGAALAQALAPYKIQGLRLRWPNDLLVGRAKLAGILVERPSKKMASIGIGLNMHNNVLNITNKVTDPPTRLADLVRKAPRVDEMCLQLADSITDCYNELTQKGFVAISSRLSTVWGGERPVVAITDKERHCGFFAGITHDGSPILRRADGELIPIPGISVNRLQELT